MLNPVFREITNTNRKFAMDNMYIGIEGLQEHEVVASREANGANVLRTKKENEFVRAVGDMAHEPMFI